MRHSKGVSTFLATLLLVSITLSLSYVVYESVSRISPPAQMVFTNQLVQVGGNVGLVLVSVNSSELGTPVAFQAGDVTSNSGILYFDGVGYGATHQLCLANATTFFAVHTTTGTLQARSNGTNWIDGQLTSALDVGAGWHEVVFSDSSSCSVTLPGGLPATYPSGEVSTLPLMGALPSHSYQLYVPTGGSVGTLALVFNGGYDRIA